MQANVLKQMLTRQGTDAKVRSEYLRMQKVRSHGKVRGELKLELTFSKIRTQSFLRIRTLTSWYAFLKVCIRTCGI